MGAADGTLLTESHTTRLPWFPVNHRQGWQSIASVQALPHFRVVGTHVPNPTKEERLRLDSLVSAHPVIDSAISFDSKLYLQRVK